MNQRDMVLYSYLKGKGGGGDSGGGTPRIIDYQIEQGGNYTDLITSKTFTMEKDDVILMCFITTSEPTMPTGFTIVAQNDNNGRYVRMAVYKASSNEIKNFRLSQNSKGAIGADFFQLRNCKFYITTDFNKVPIDGSYHTFSTKMSIVFLCSTASNGTKLGFQSAGTADIIEFTNQNSTSYCRTKTIFNFGTYTGKSIGVIGPGTLNLTGVYIEES